MTALDRKRPPTKFRRAAPSAFPITTAFGKPTIAVWPGLYMTRRQTKLGVRIVVMCQATCPRQLPKTKLKSLFNQRGCWLAAIPMPSRPTSVAFAQLRARPCMSRVWTKASLGNATGLIAGAAAVLGESGKFVQLHPDSVIALKVGNLISGTDGFFRMMTRGADKKFVKQLQWEKDRR